MMQEVERLKAENASLLSQLAMANCWNNTVIKAAGLEGSWADGGVSVSQVVSALRSLSDTPSQLNEP